MSNRRGWLIDVYDTVVAVDFENLWERLAAHAGLRAPALRAAADEHLYDVMVGRCSLPDAMRHALTACGRESDDRVVTDLVDADERLLVESSHVFPDAVDFLQCCRGLGEPTALVSNCAENTRHLLASTGLDALVDATVLSCEIGSAKPDPVIYDHALAVLGVDASNAVLIDDQRAYCDGAVECGITAIQIVRHGSPEPSRSDTRVRVIRSLTEITAEMA